MYLISNWIVDGINNKLYKYTNDVLEEYYNINISKSIGNAAIAVSTNEYSVFITCPTAGTVMEFNIARKEFVRSITVGGCPMGICEGIPYGEADLSKPYFVSNYANNSVSIIRDGIVVQTIPVGFGPRSLATDGYGRIFVGNYLDGTVSILVPKENKYVLLKTIKVEQQPVAIAINYNDDVYVACRSSIYKIRKNGIVRKFIIDGRPTSLTADKYGNIWATNNTKDRVIKIDYKETMNNFSTGGTGPMYCSSDKTGDIIVLNTGNNKIGRLNEDGSLTTIIPLLYTPIGNGDFIGFTSRLNILDDIHVHGDEKITWEDLDEDIKNRIEQGGVDPETLILKSENITYENNGYENVNEALNDIIYNKLGILNSDIKSFSVTPSIAEKGETIQQVIFNYQIDMSNGISMAKIDNEVGYIDVRGISAVISGLNITEDTIFTLTGYTEEGFAGSKTAEIKFDSKIRFGVSSSNITTSDGVLALSNSVFVEDNDPEYYRNDFDITRGNGYMYFAVPKYLGIDINNFYTNGFNDSNWDTTDVIVNISESISVEYTVFKSGYTHNLTNNSIHIKIDKKK